MNNTILIIFLLAFSSSRDAFGYTSHNRPEEKLAAEVIERCESAKEFITTYEYLREHKALGLNEKTSKEAAVEVSKGCTGSAERFVKTFELLLKADAGPRSSLAVAIKLANKPSTYADTFVAVFTKSYLAEYLDLDYKTSFDLAEGLSVSYLGHPKIAAEDFIRLVQFCTSDKNVGLSKPRCGVIAGRVVKKAERFNVRIAEEFIKVYEYLVSEAGPSATVSDALKISETVIEQGPEASDNFITAYKYGLDKSGLDMTAKESIQFAKQISSHTWDRLYTIENDVLKIPSIERVPAQDVPQK